MILDVILVLFLLWFMGIVEIPGISLSGPVILKFNNRPVTLAQFLTFFLILMVLSILPKPIKQIAGVIYILWILSTVGIITIAGLPNILVIGIIAGLVIAIFQKYISSE